MGKVISAANGAKAHSDGHALAATSHSWRCSLPLSDPRNAAQNHARCKKTIPGYNFLLSFPANTTGHTLTFLSRESVSQGLPGGWSLQYQKILDS